MEEKDYNSMSYDELSQISRDDHQEDTRQYDIQQNALCLVVIGAICFVCAILFLILSFKRKNQKLAGLEPLSLQFFICVACFIAAAILLTIGLIKFFKAHKLRKELAEEIIAVTLLKSSMMTQD